MNESVEQVAARHLEAEEEQRREARLRELAAEEEQRRAREEHERERLAAIERAREEAERLAFERVALADQAEREIETLGRTLQELDELDRLHRTALRAAGESVPSLFLGPVVQRWVGDRLSNPGNPSPHGGASLRERDPLTSG